MSVHIITYSFMVMERRQLDVCQCQKLIIHSRSFVPDNGSSNNSLVLHNCSKQSSTGHQSNITKRLNQNQIGILRIVFSPVTCCLRVVYCLKNGYPKNVHVVFCGNEYRSFGPLRVWMWQPTWRRRNCSSS